LEAEAD